MNYDIVLFIPRENKIHLKLTALCKVHLQADQDLVIQDWHVHICPNVYIKKNG